jgi:hypothetical protein
VGILNINNINYTGLILSCISLYIIALELNDSIFITLRTIIILLKELYEYLFINIAN